MTLKKVQNIFIPKNMNCITTIMSKEDNQKIKMTTKQTEHSCKHANRLKYTLNGQNLNFSPRKEPQGPTKA